MSSIQHEKESKDASTRELVAFDEIISSTFGGKIDSPHSTWKDLGLTSLMAVELVNELEECFPVKLSPKCFEDYTTPEKLKEHILNTSPEKSLVIKKPPLSDMSRKDISWNVMGLLQMIGVTILMFSFTMSIIVPWKLSQVFSSNPSIFTPLIIPSWMLTFSIMVILLKWLFIGRYTSCQLNIPSINFLKWWWIDRLLQIWEHLIGVFILDTPLIWVFYRLMGADIHPSVRIGTFLREFDLVHIEKEVCLKGSSVVRCRTFKPGRKMQFRPVRIYSHATIKGMVCPGVEVGKGCFVDARSVLREGAQAPESTSLSGNPAAESPKKPVYDGINPSWCYLGMLKLTWILINICIFAGLVSISRGLIFTFGDWRYGSVMKWVFQIIFSILLLLPVNILTKWLFIGRHKVGLCSEGAWQIFADWAVDYQFMIFYRFVGSFFECTRIWNAILKLYGLDIDFKSVIVRAMNFPPSTVDLFRIRRSFIPTSSFETTQGGEYLLTVLDGCSLGYGARVGAGVTVTNVVVPPLQYLEEDYVKTDSLEYDGISIYEELVSIVLRFFWFLVLIICLFPAYEWYLWCEKVFPFELAVPLLALAFLIHTTCLLLVLRLLQSVALFGSLSKGKPWSRPLYILYLFANAYAQRNSLLILTLWGTPMINYIAKFFGSSVGECTLIFCHSFCIHDFPHVSIESGTIIDDASIAGHEVNRFGTFFGPVSVSGVVHEGTILLAGMRTCEEESGPWRLCAKNRILREHKP